VDVLFFVHIVLIDPLIFEAYFYFKGLGQEKVIENKRTQRNDKGSGNIRSQYTCKTSATAQDRNKLTLLRHFGSKEDHRNKNEQWTEEIAIVRNEQKVIINDDLAKRDIIGSKGGQLVLDVEYNKDEQDERDGKEEGGKEFP
jgi:hypothetical protein